MDSNPLISSTNEFREYLMKHRLPDVYALILSGLIVQMPEKPLKFIAEQLATIKQQSLDKQLSKEEPTRSLLPISSLNLETFIGHLHPALKNARKPF